MGAHGGGSVGGGTSVSASAEVGDTGVTAQVGVNAPVNTVSISNQYLYAWFFLSVNKR